jgi:hypothetical protein
MGYVTFIDGNLYRKRERALARYFRKSYKELIFKTIPKLKEDGKKDGLYTHELETEDLFKKVYGAITLKFTVKNDNVIIEEIEPSEMLTACYEKDLPIYKGVPYRNVNDLKKIKMMEAIMCQKKN